MFNGDNNLDKGESSWENGFGVFSAEWQANVEKSAIDIVRPVLVVPIDDASVEAMVERACVERYGNRYEACEGAENAKHLRASVGDMLRAALGLDGGGA